MDRRNKQKIITKKHLARIERERIQRRWIMIGSIAVLVLVVGLIGFGILQQQVLLPRQPVAIVGTDKISLSEFQDRVKFQRLQLVQQYDYTYNLMQSFGSDANTQSYFTQSLKQIETQLNPTTMGENVLTSMIEDKLIRQEAARRGITVTKEEVDKRLQEEFGYFGGGMAPTATTVPTTAPTSTLSPLQMTLVPPTPTPTVTPTSTQTITSTQVISGTPTSIATLEATSTPVITATQSLTATSVVTSTPETTPTERPTATPKTTQAFGEEYQTYLDNLKKNVGLNESQLRNIIESLIYREKVMEAITGDLPRTEEQVWARQILVDSEDKAKEIYQQLQAGGDFVKLAAENSTDTSNAQKGGDLGWFGAGAMVPEFEKAAFALKVGEISQPVKSQFGWHIIQALGHEERPLSASDYDKLRQTKFSDWLTQQRSEADVKTYDNWQSSVPTEPSIDPSKLIQS